MATAVELIELAGIFGVEILVRSGELVYRGEEEKILEFQNSEYMPQVRSLNDEITKVLRERGAVLASTVTPGIIPGWLIRCCVSRFDCEIARGMGQFVVLFCAKEPQFGMANWFRNYGATKIEDRVCFVCEPGIEYLNVEGFTNFAEALGLSFGHEAEAFHMPAENERIIFYPPKQLDAHCQNLMKIRENESILINPPDPILVEP